MKKENINEVLNQVEKVYQSINDLISLHDLDMIDLAYPNHDGIQDTDVTSDMMLLRQSANSLSRACNALVEQLTRIIGDENKELEEELKKLGYRYRDNEDGTYDVCYDHAQDSYFEVNGYHVATVKEDENLWYINNNEGLGWGEYSKQDWTLKDAIYDQCIDEHIN